MYSQLQYNVVHHIDGIIIQWFWNSLLYSLPNNLIYDISWCRPMCNRRGKQSVCSQYLYLFKTLRLFQKLTTEMKLPCKVHSAWKHNISGLLEIIYIHKYTSQCAKSMKSVSTAFWYKFVLFCPFRIKWGLKIRHVNVMIWRSQHVEACLPF